MRCTEGWNFAMKQKKTMKVTNCFSFFLIKKFKCVELFSK